MAPQSVVSPISPTSAPAEPKNDLEGVAQGKIQIDPRSREGSKALQGVIKGICEKVSELERIQDIANNEIETTKERVYSMQQKFESDREVLRKSLKSL